MPKRRVAGSLSAKQRAQRQAAARASAAKRAKHHDFVGRADMEASGGDRNSPYYKSGVSNLRKAQAQHKISQGQKPKGKPKKQSPYAALSSQGQAPKGKSPVKTASGPQSTGPQAFSKAKAMRSGGPNKKLYKDVKQKRRAGERAHKRGTAIANAYKKKGY